ncbi:hypothetical protein Q0V21_18890 [Paenibacillus sp. 11B]|nr:hypothetical protein [Paenibacillus sp. 11B]
MFKADGQCKDCLFLRLCKAVELPHCDGAYAVDRSGESGVVSEYGHEDIEDSTSTG